MKYNWICKMEKEDCSCNMRTDDGFCKENIDWKCCPHMMNYSNAMWCRDDIFESNYNIVNNDENIWNINYDYQEYGFWYHVIDSDEIGESSIIY